MKILGVIIVLLFSISFISLIFNFIAGKVLKKEKFAKLIKKNLIFFIIFFIAAMIIVGTEEDTSTQPEKTEIKEATVNTVDKKEKKIESKNEK